MKIFEKYFKGDTTVLNEDYILSIPEFAKLKDCQQNPRWHAEGDVWKHTLKCLEHAYDIINTRDEFLIEDKEHERRFIMAVLFHDIGKAATTEFVKGNWHAYGHDIIGEKIARRILWDENLYEREYVCSMVRYHMDILKIGEKKHPLETIVKMSKNVNMWDMFLLKECDMYGSIQDPEVSTFEKDTDTLCSIQSVFGSLSRNMQHAYRLVFGTGKDESAVNVWVLIGLPGAGKNTWIAENGENCVAVSRDDIRAELGFCGEGDKIIGTPQQENAVTAVFNDRLKKAVQSGKDVIINNINLKKKYRDAYHVLLAGFNVNWNYVYIEAPTLQDNIDRRDGQIDASQFREMIERFDWPVYEEYDHFITQKQR